MSLLLLLFLAGFLCGSIPTGYLVGRAKGIDVRAHGSGNIGATNVARILGKKCGALVLLVDIAKGFVPCYVVSQYSFAYGICTAIGTVLGHTFTPFLKFRGGRGVATALGCVLGLMPAAGLLCLAVWMIVLRLSGYVSLASISGALVLPLWTYGAGRFSGVLSVARLAFALVISATVVLRHIPNVKRLFAKEEPKFRL